MRLTIDARYMKVPVRYQGKERYFCFFDGNRLVYWFLAAYDVKANDCVYDADLRLLQGKTTELRMFTSSEGHHGPMQVYRDLAAIQAYVRGNSISDACPDNLGQEEFCPEELCDPNFCPIFSNKTEPVPDDSVRPLMHFTAKCGWINDPNGLVRTADGLWHLFFQHNPYGREWGNMHWGHAISRDLLCWEQQEEALFQDDRGMMYSGCALPDPKNRSGLFNLRSDPQKRLLFYYTSAGTHFEQCLAYSEDGGKTLVKYVENPVIPEIGPGNRDPKLVYDREFDRYLCPLHLSDRDASFAIFETRDLLHFSMLQTLQIGRDRECPNLYPLVSPDGRVLWVLTGASDIYLIGEMKQEGFFPVQDAKKLSFDSESYAAQIYWQEKGQPTVRMAWNRSPIPGVPYNCSMGTPQEMFLKYIDGEYFLAAKPASEFGKAFPSHAEYALTADPESAENPLILTETLSSPAAMITIQASDEPSYHAEFPGLVIDASPEGVRISGFLSPLPWSNTVRTEVFLPRRGPEHMLRIISDTTSVEFSLNDTALTSVPKLTPRDASPAFTIRSKTAVRIRINQ